MNKREKQFLTIFLLLALALYLIVFLHMGFLREFMQGKLRTYGYIALLIFTFITDYVQQPFGPETPVIISAIIGLDILSIFLITLCGSFLGTTFAFYSGKKLMLRKNKKHGKYEILFFKYKEIGLVLAALTPIPYPLFCWFAGYFNLKLRTLLVYGYLPRILRFGLPLLFMALILM